MKALTESSRHIFALLVLCTWFWNYDVKAQDFEAKQRLRAGNESYAAGDYEGALQEYEAASKADTSYAKATYNLANAMYQAGKIDEAMELYEEASGLFSDKKDQARTHHNIGRVQLETGLRKIRAMAATGGQPSDKSQDPRPHLHAALDEFKQALLLDPDDSEARYNYSYTRKLLDKLPPSDEEQQQDEQEEEKEQEKEEQEQQEDSQDKEEEGGQDEQQKGEEEKEGEQDNEQDENQGDKNNQDQGEQDKEEQGDERQNEPQAQPQDPNRMNAEQQLDLLDQAEKELQKAMAKKRMAGSPIKVEKDW